MMEEQIQTTPFDPNKINEVPPERLRFPLRYSREAFQPPESAAVTEFERTPEGYLEIEWQYKDVQRALALDFDQHVMATYDRPQLEEAVQSQVDAVNAKREEMNEERRQKSDDPIELVDVSTVNATFLRHLLRPNWQEQVPTDGGEDSEAKWQQFKDQYPEHIQINLDELRELDGKMRILSGDEELRTEVQSIHAERIEVMRAAAVFLGADRKIDALARRVSELYRAAGASNRSLTAGERKHIERLQTQQEQVRGTRGVEITSDRMLNEVKQEVHRRIDIQRRRDFEHGLVMTDQMRSIIDDLLPSLAQGKPALLVGETGGAKTALAEYVCREYFGVEPEFISGYGDVNTYQVMGKATLKNEGGAPVSDFAPGPMVRGMEEGRPVIIDEGTAAPAEFLKRLNKILQLRPGDKFIIQEDSGREITIKPGFFIMVTANEKSKRYKGVEDLSVEFQNRFGANVVRVYYPDSDVVYGQPPVENAVIAKAALTDRSGSMVSSIDPEELERFVRVCHVSQQVFSGNFGQGFQDFVSAEQIADSRPGLEEAVLAPRTMVALLEKVRDSNGTLSLDQVISRFVTGIKSGNDRSQMTTILQGHGFLKTGDQ
jgi:MoxR-like ATPase